MILSQACKYGIRALLYLARHSAGQPVLSRHIAHSLDLPEHFLAKVLQELSRKGLLRSFKGRGGGFQLARPAAQIHLMEIVAAIEGGHFGEDCVLGLPQCSEESPCFLHARWVSIREEVLNLLAQQNLEALAAGESEEAI